MDAIVEFAPAKLNLYLHITGRRADGYHLVDSLIAFAGVGDSVAVAASADGPALAVDGPRAAEVPEGPDNLVLRAAVALAARLGRPAHVHVALTKRLPVASGIGGGSADAAAVLRALGRLWGASAADLAAVAPGLGADVPVCLAGRRHAVTGIGEVLGPAPALPSAGLVLANPGVPLETPPVFKARTGPFSAADPLTDPPADAAALAKALERRGNDLTAAACRLCPAVAEALEALAADRHCLLARMSGSGATCFGIYADATVAAAAAARLRARHADWWVAEAPLLG
ncbi:MAG: 4-(cytidine 5'-diphospho)-2-C-methyl-D-erythritol kinase [Rhodospirillaceae bacterium]|nr:4-(cytidine 5'-diphospho)-2-C-methyl-D-erythritol kinase [Rhodospirillaceae bacterium]